MLTKEQIELRRTRIGASEVAAILGLDPYKSAMDVFMEKTLPSGAVPKDHQAWGHYVEDPIVRFTVDRKGYTLIPPPDGAEKWPSLVHPTLPLICTPDALAIAKDGKVAIQGKNDQGHGQLEWGEPGTDDAPQGYIAQAIIEIGVLRARGYDVVRDELAVVRRGAPPESYPITFDEELFGVIAEHCSQWVRDHLETGRPPDGSPGDTAEYVKRRFAKHGENLLQPTPELVAMVQGVSWLKKQEKTLKEELTAAENVLKTAIGEAQGIVGLCTWKMQKGSTYVTTRQPGRVLRLAKED